MKDFLWLIKHGDVTIHPIHKRPRIWYYRVWHDGYIYAVHLLFFAICIQPKSQ